MMCNTCECSEESDDPDRRAHHFLRRLLASVSLVAFGENRRRRAGQEYLQPHHRHYLLPCVFQRRSDWFFKRVGTTPITQILRWPEIVFRRTKFLANARADQRKIWPRLSVATGTPKTVPKNRNLKTKNAESHSLFLFEPRISQSFRRRSTQTHFQIPISPANRAPAQRFAQTQVQIWPSPIPTHIRRIVLAFISHQDPITPNTNDIQKKGIDEIFKQFLNM